MHVRRSSPACTSSPATSPATPAFPYRTTEPRSWSPATSQKTAAGWLLAEYDNTDNPFENLGDDNSGTLWRGVYVQPIFTLKSALDAGKQMRISARDYADPGRWFL